MKTLEIMSMVGCAIFLLCLSVIFSNGDSHAGEDQYPIKVEIIDKGQARYDTPENAYAAMISSLIKRDIEWYYEAFTKESAAQNKREYQEAGIDPRKKFDTVKGLKDVFIIDRMEYKSGVVLIVQTHEQDGTIMQGPSAFMKEGGKWKMTNKYAADVELHEYLDYKPGVMISSTLKLRPTQWNLNWYNWIKQHQEETEWIAHFAEKVSILCLIGNLKDNQGNLQSVEEITPETILLNDILAPQPWVFNREEKIALILKSKKDRYPKKIKGFKEWHHRKKSLKDYKGPVMLVKFNKFKAMETIPAMIPRKEYEVIVSGELKDGKRFKGSAKIEITEWKGKHKWKWEHPDWLNADKDIDNWWNKEKDFERWWEKIRKKHKRETGAKGYKR